MSDSNDNLFQPSLNTETPAQALYSPVACWITAFFGGPFAALLIFGVNLRRAGLAARNASWLALAAAIAIASLVHLVRIRLTEGETTADDRLVVRGAALVIAALLYWRLSSAYRAQQMFGIEPPQPWLMALAAIAFNILISALPVLILAGSYS